MPKPILYGLGVFIGTIAKQSFDKELWAGLIVIVVGSFVVSLLEVIADNMKEKTGDS